MSRFVTFITCEQDDILCMTEEEFKSAKANDDPSVASDLWDEWIWQFADSKEQAIAQHVEKMDEWEKNPSKETY